MGKNNTPQTPQETAGGGFAIGDAVQVTADGSTYFKKCGKVTRFCKNGSARRVYVKLEGLSEKMLSTNSLTKMKGPEPVEKSTDSTGVPSTIMKDSKDSVASAESAFGRRVLTLFEYVSHMKSEYNEDKELSAKLYEIEKMIIGLSLDT